MSLSAGQPRVPERRLDVLMEELPEMEACFSLSGGLLLSLATVKLPLSAFRSRRVWKKAGGMWLLWISSH